MESAGAALPELDAVGNKSKPPPVRWPRDGGVVWMLGSKVSKQLLQGLTASNHPALR